MSPALHAALDRPVWSALTGGHRHFALGAALAKRYPRDVGPFAALADDSREAWDALGALLQPGEAVMLVTPSAPPQAAGFALTPLDPVLQMIATRAPEPSTLPLLVLGAADAPDMRALAELTNPGPFAGRTHELGEFLGIRAGGRLAAMTGERMRPTGAVEVSAVCVHPDFRGKAYARQLLAERTRRIAAQGDQPFLHVYPSNKGAIALYESLGYVVRTQLHLTRVALAP
ncbi:GNAT family N-acetyltransferase [Massilia sp. IC2-477]|uniref:GNAT family N-acetyltransferase n=1 Tax=unclassified Massilia TaxID=2609279 RepID=UPI001D0F4F86|nr:MULTISPECIES: GNAT family N-acetyltransferase [unclassified Massilia]MCC2956132.1 GNAT family N-acetyltransferase [Massilia sp. IC2-477]MCC2970717.1 GNAT family N-acetyltransferase [Massilia sp. IC2-476]